MKDWSCRWSAPLRSCTGGVQPNGAESKGNNTQTVKTTSREFTSFCNISINPIIQPEAQVLNFQILAIVV